MKPRKNETKDKFINRCSIDLMQKDVIASKQLGCILCNRYWTEFRRIRKPIMVFKDDTNKVVCNKKICKICKERKAKRKIDAGYTS